MRVLCTCCVFYWLCVNGLWPLLSPYLTFTDPEGDCSLESNLLRSYKGSAKLHAVSTNTELLRVYIKNGAYDLGWEIRHDKSCNKGLLTGLWLLRDGSHHFLPGVSERFTLRRRWCLSWTLRFLVPKVFEKWVFSILFTSFFHISSSPWYTMFYWYINVLKLINEIKDRGGEHTPGGHGLSTEIQANAWEMHVWETESCSVWLEY